MLLFVAIISGFALFGYGFLAPGEAGMTCLSAIVFVLSAGCWVYSRARAR